MNRPLVSVVLGTYNGEKFLVEQLESILNQAYQPLELVISDDDSTDSTRNLLKQYEHDPRVRIFYQQKNLGLPANYSFAAQQAKGSFIAFSDQDDVWLPGKIEKLINAIGESPLVYSDSILISEEGTRLDKKLSDLKKMYSGSDSRGYFLYSCVWGHGMMVTRELLEKSIPVPATVHHDIWITYQAFLHGGIRYLDEPLTLYRQRKRTNSQPRGNGWKKIRRYEAYKCKLEWLQLMMEHERPEYHSFYSRLYELYAAKENKGYVLPLVPFLLKNRRSVFSLSNKGFASQFVEILKQARGERREARG